MTVTFAGHGFVENTAIISKRVYEIIKKEIEDEANISFYCGGYGEFDALCAAVCREIKKEVKGVEIAFITPYLDISNQQKVKDVINQKLYDIIIYPPIENVPPRFAISKRNEWMVLNSDLIICYVNHSYGGAYKTMRFAERKQKRIINICKNE